MVSLLVLSLLVQAQEYRVVGAQEYRVDTHLGPVLGGLRTTTTTGTVVGNPYVSFQGLPYASPPVGSLRLRPPM